MHEVELLNTEASKKSNGTGQVLPTDIQQPRYVCWHNQSETPKALPMVSLIVVLRMMMVTPIVMVTTMMMMVVVGMVMW